MADNPSAPDGMLVDEHIQRESMRSGLVKFDGKFANQVQNPLEVPKFLQTLCCNLLREDPTFQLGDKDGNPMAMSAIPDTYQGCVAKFNLKVVPKRNHQHLMFVTTFISTKPFGMLKKASYDWIRRHNLFMNRHALNAATLDIAIAGWILRAHPRYHSPDKQQTLMEKKMQEWWKSLGNTDKLHWSTKFTEDENGDLNVPAFFVNARSVKGNDNTGRHVQDTAFLIMGPTARIKDLMEVMEEVFQPNNKNDKDNTVHFVPFRLQKESPKTQYQLIVQHKRYLEESQNVSIAGMHTEFMKGGITINDPSGKETHTTLEEAFLLHPAITRIDPGTFVIPLGKWNVTTTKHGAEAAKAWIDKVIEAMPEVQRCNTGYEAFPNVVRMKAVQSTIQVSKYDSWWTEEEDTLPSIRKDKRKSPPSYSTNPQEPEYPTLLHFDLSDSPPTGSYAQAASRRSKTAGAVSNNTSTFISTMSSDKIRGVETEIKEMRQEWRETMDYIKIIKDKDNNSNDNGTTASPTSMDNVLLQEILKKLDRSQATMDQHQTSAQTRFDTLENQQSGLGTRFDSLEDQQSEFGASIVEVTTTVSGISKEQAALRQINEDLLHRINKLEESSNTSITLRSPVRKCRPKPTDDSSQNSTTEDSPQSMITDDPPTNNGWDAQDELLEFSEEENMDEIKTPPRTSASAGSNPGRRS
jgi:hypothetical protein